MRNISEKTKRVTSDLFLYSSIVILVIVSAYMQMPWVGFEIELFLFGASLLMRTGPGKILKEYHFFVLSHPRLFEVPQLEV